MSDDRLPCDHQVDVDDSTWFECELPMHHPGPHKYTFTWENEPHGPQLPVTRRAPIWVPEAWADSVMASLRASLLRHPVLSEKALNDMQATWDRNTPSLRPGR